MNKLIYLDHNATTPVAPEVIAAMTQALNSYGNPSSAYAVGQEASKKVAHARSAVASLIGANASEITFTGCATEANNLAILGVAAKSVPNRRHMIISAIEHPAVLEPARHLESQGWELTILPVDGNGLVSAQDVLNSIRTDTALVSVMLANNEIGTIQPIAEIASVLKDSKILFHTDAAQAVGKIPVKVDHLGVDLLTIAGHKFQASKGIGALYVRAGTPIQNVLFGGGQEFGLRPGTENVPAIVGLGVAAEIAEKRLNEPQTTALSCAEQLFHSLKEAIPGLVLNGHPDLRLPNTLNVSFPDVSGQKLLDIARDEIMASVGSACHSNQEGPSGVFGVMGLDDSRALGAVRLSTGWTTTKDEIRLAAIALVRAWNELKAKD